MVTTISYCTSVSVSEARALKVTQRKRDRTAKMGSHPDGCPLFLSPLRTWDITTAAYVTTFWGALWHRCTKASGKVRRNINPWELKAISAISLISEDRCCGFPFGSNGFDKKGLSIGCKLMLQIKDAGNKGKCNCCKHCSTHAICRDICIHQHLYAPLRDDFCTLDSWKRKWFYLWNRKSQSTTYHQHIFSFHSPCP